MIEQQLAAIRTGILDARKDFNKLYHFWSGTCDAEMFSKFLAMGDFYVDPLTRKAWQHTIFKEIDRVEALFAVGAQHV
jgi:hypothetical protein